MTHYGQIPQPPKQGKSTGTKVAIGCGIFAILGVLAFGGCAVVGGVVLNEADKAVKADQKADARAKKDVELISCEITAEDYIGLNVEAKVKITNGGKKRANYVVEGEFLDQDGNKIDQLLATVDDLAPGSSSTQNFTGLFTTDQLEDVTKGTCKILDVTRSEWLASN